ERHHRDLDALGDHAGLRKDRAQEARARLLTRGTQRGLRAAEGVRMPRTKHPETAPEIADEVQRQIDQWLEAMRWQRVANRALCFLSLTHTQFLVLLGAARALAGRKAAVSVADIADAAALDASTTSILITKLDRK